MLPIRPMLITRMPVPLGALVPPPPAQAVVDWPAVSDPCGKATDGAVQGLVPIVVIVAPHNDVICVLFFAEFYHGFDEPG